MRKGAFLLLCPLFLFGDFGVATQVAVEGKYQNLDFNLYDGVLLPQVEKAFTFPTDWQFGARLEFPYIWLWGKEDVEVELDSDGIIEEQPERPTVVQTVPFHEEGFGDLVAKALLISPSIRGMNVGFGSDFAFPTAQKEDLGTGKYSARLLFGLRYDRIALASGAVVSLAAKYQFSYAGDPNRPSFRIFSIEPGFVIQLGKKWALNLSSECQLNCKTNQWFVPISVSLAKQMGHLILNGDYQRGLVTDFPIFQDEYKLKASYLF